MKKVKKLLVLLTMLTAVLSLTCSSVYADEVRKGSCRVLFCDEEYTNEDELVYNGHRYLPGIYIADALTYLVYEVGADIDYAYTETNTYTGYETYLYTPSGYMTLKAGSTDVRMGFYSATDNFDLFYPAVMYDGQMYVSMEDIAYVMGCYYGFDASKNTMYFYY